MNERTYNNSIAQLRSPERIERVEVKRVVDLCFENSDIKSVLDVGTGSGLFAEEFYKRKMEVAGIDFNQEMINAAKEYLPQCEFKLSPMEKIPYKDKSFDLLFMGLVFHEADDFRKAISEAFRTAKKYVFLLEWDYIVQEIGPQLKDRLKEEFIRQLAKEAGFKETKMFPLKNLVLYKLII